MERWNECLELIRQQIKDEWVVATWFDCISCVHYEVNTRVLLLSVPSKYVVEFVEHYYVRLLQQVITRVYGEGVTLQYHLAAQSAAVAPLKSVQQPAISSGHLAVANAHERLKRGLEHFLSKERTQWLSDYDEIADWLADNKGRGLLLVGTSGLGKSVICTRILPVLIGGEAVVVSSREMGQQIDTLLQKKCVIIDDLGHEPVTEMVNYRKRTPFLELCDAAEQRGVLLIVNTTLSTNKIRNPLYPMSIESRYGAEVLDRLRATTRVVELHGKSMRR